MSTTPDLAARAAATSGSDMWHTTPIPGELRRISLADGPHGLRKQPEDSDHLGIGTSLPATCFPPAVGLGASWNPELVHQVGAALGAEASSLGVDVLLGPGMNIKRSPLCGRNFEYVSEDPHVTARIAAALVTGIQSTGVGACVKHFAVNNQETDRMRVSADVDERTLREIYLAAFEQVIRETNPSMVMCSYNRINGVYASQHPWLLTELLRGEWGFEGPVVSDWGAVADRVAALAAGLDLEMPPSGTDDRIVSAVRNGDLPESVVDTAVGRLKHLQDRVSSDSSRNVDHAGHDALARAVARECAVLLKNENDVLPLDPTSSLAVIGEFARTPRFQGGGSSHVVPTTVHAAVDVLDGSCSGPVTFAPGFRLDGQPDAALVEEAVQVAANHDIAVLFLGLPDAAESEGYDREDIELPEVQRDLLIQVRGVCDRVVVVLSNGGVVSVSDWEDNASAVLEGWLLGQAGGAALADLLTGVVSPSGRLTETIPLRLADHPSYLSFPGEHGHSLYGEGLYVGYRYFDTVQRPVAYPFGHGLTYTSFSYSDLELTTENDTTWTVSCTVTNTGGRAAAEVPQLYVGVQESHPTRPSHELRGFAKVFLEPGESTRVQFPLTGRDLSTWDRTHQRWSLAAGTYTVTVGASSRDPRLSTTLVTAGDRFVAPLGAHSTISEWRAHPIGGPVLAEQMRFMRGADGISEEMVQMAGGMPLSALCSFNMGVTTEMLDQLVAGVEEQRQQAIARGEITG
ncbi:glycoside hydrolase family 3 C-terminal domain-containing protein [Lipingzhangella sp. LS1_29]|uniref:Glycoside hydrolase family 3 C-terminal domain-containing protein n=1 Tax=Lipingzhangella rawalii TaxID=2055835 RepID=A0ABU2H8F2_9ACTN|nr:glycoside hydrolase family 3 C-terminal domain-containing protein [Lipingzhangella rawalii]MDS1271134.1 glycoside hydrolase family 3 C-terminal domain-containing protein [Lipingzhangella rawalii]